MRLATAVIIPAGDKNTSSLFLQEAKSIKALLRQHEARAYMAVDVLNDPAREKLPRFLAGSQRRKAVLMYHHIGPIASGRLQQLIDVLPDLQLLYINGPMDAEQLQLCFDAGVKAVLTTGTAAYSPAHHLFSRKFYANLAAGARLENAFEQARIFVEIEKGVRIEKPLPFEDGLALAKKRGAQLPWTLLFDEGDDNALSFSLPQKSVLQFVSKKEHRLWLKRQLFKDDFLQDWGKNAHQYHMLIVEDGAVGMAHISQLIKGEIALPYQEARVRVLKIDFSPNLEEAKVKLAAQIRQAISLTTSKENTFPADADSMIFVLKIYQSDWRHYGAKLLNSLKTDFSAFYGEKKSPDFIFIALLIADLSDENKNFQKSFSLKKILGSCKGFSPFQQIDFRL